ncbi:MAG: pilus assembly protein, partial [Elusimicrobiota bacterium]|nr:pilus assembly protein [Elusimicrobiota bacterium]
MLFKNFNNNDGQSLTEAALIMPLVSFFLFTVIWFGQIMLTWQQLVGAARYGTDLISYTPFSKIYIEQDIVNYLCDKKTIGRTLNEDKLKVVVKIYDVKKMDFTLSLDNISNLNPLDFISNIGALNPFTEDKSYVEIVYSYDMPFVFKLMGKESIDIKA